MKKQTIILTHGSSAPTTATTGFTQGELLVQHGSDALNTALHTLDNDGNWVTFPSKDWIDAKNTVINGGVNAIDERLTAVENDYLKNADKEALSNAITAETSARTSAITAEANARESADTEIKNTIGTGFTTGKTVADAIDAINETIGKLDETYATDAQLQSAVSSLTSSLNSSKTTLTEGTNGNVKVTKTTVEGHDNYTVEGVNLATTAVTDGLNTRLTAVENDYLKNADKEALSNAITAETSARESADTEIKNTIGTGFTTEKTVAAAIAAETSARTSADNAINEKISTIQGSDTAKSMRDVATEEIAKVVANAPEDFDTLKEIADWIANDTTGAADMANDITELKGTVNGYTSTNTVKKEVNAINERLTAVENDYLKNADKEALSNAITAETSARTSAITAEANARESADTEIKNTIGTGFTTGKTVADAIDAINETIGKLDETYATDAQLQSAVSSLTSSLNSSKTTLTEGTNGNVKVTKTTVEGHDNYTVEGVNLATTAVTDGLNTRLTAVENDYLKNADKEALSNAITAETSARESADTEIKNTIGTGFTTEKTVAAAIAAEASTRESADNAINEKISAIQNKYVSTISITNTGTNKITAQKTETSDKNGFVYTFNFDNMVIDGGTY